MTEYLKFHAAKMLVDLAPGLLIILLVVLLIGYVIFMDWWKRFKCKHVKTFETVSGVKKCWHCGKTLKD